MDEDSALLFIMPFYSFETSHWKSLSRCYSLLVSRSIYGGESGLSSGVGWRHWFVLAYDTDKTWHGIDMLFFISWEPLGQQLELDMSFRVYFTVSCASLPPAVEGLGWCIFWPFRWCTICHDDTWSHTAHMMHVLMFLSNISRQSHTHTHTSMVSVVVQIRGSKLPAGDKKYSLIVGIIIRSLNKEWTQFEILPWVSSSVEIDIKVSMPKHISTCHCISQWPLKMIIHFADGVMFKQAS